MELTRLITLCFIILLPACSLLHRGEPLAEPVDLIAVLPIERDEAKASPDVDKDHPRLAPEAAAVTTAKIYEVISHSPHWRFVSDLTVTDALKKIDRQGGMAVRAVQLGKAVGADAVLCGKVSRFSERVGTELGAREPAGVSFELELISTKSGAVLWKGSFSKTQEPLSSNLLNWWMFWRGGPKWFSAAELTYLGVQSLLEELDRRIVG